MKTLSVIIPCYNEESIIQECYTRVKTILNTLDWDSRIVFVNDGSTDKTFDLLYRIAQADKKATVINFSRNFGHQAAVTAGIHLCRTDWAIIMDADMQDPPELIPSMIRKLQEEKANGVYCVRQSRSGENHFKFWSSKRFYRTLNTVSGMKFPLDVGDFRLIDSKIINEFKKFKEKGKYVRGLISWIGFKQVPFYYERKARIGGKSKYPLRKMFSLAFSALFYFSKNPLQGAITLGFVAVIIGIAMALWYILGKLFRYTDAESGWTSLMITIIFFSGVQLLTIGVLGQYIGILFDEVKERPEYIIEHIINEGE